MLDLCRAEKPPLEEIAPGRLVKCHRWREIVAGNLILDFSPTEKPIKGAPPEDNQYLLAANDLSKRFGKRTLWTRLTGDESQFVQAVDDVSLRVRSRAPHR